MNPKQLQRIRHQGRQWAQAGARINPGIVFGFRLAGQGFHYLRNNAGVVVKLSDFAYPGEVFDRLSWTESELTYLQLGCVRPRLAGVW